MGGARDTRDGIDQLEHPFSFDILAGNHAALDQLEQR
jgi:hypothetical protein